MRQFLLCALCVLCGSKLQADFIVTSGLPEYGWYNSDGIRGTNNSLTGQSGFGNNTFPMFHSYFTFDLDGFAGDGTEATITFTLDRYDSNDASETFSLRQFNNTVTIEKLKSGGNPPLGQEAIDVFNDLGTGALFAQGTVTAADVGSNITLDLNTAALNALNAAAGELFAFGVSLEGQFSQDTNEFIRFGVDVDPAATINIDNTFVPPPTGIPEPGSMLLLGIGSLALLYRMRRQQ